MFRQVSALDFLDIKASIRDYLKSTEIFNGFNYEASAISLLIDVLAYNTYYTSLNANLVVNETFLDSAIIRDNVVRLARVLNYFPSSLRSSSTDIILKATPNIGDEPAYLTLKSGVVANGTNTNGNYIFSIPEDISVPIINNTCTWNIKAHEGIYFDIRYVVDYNAIQRFLVPNIGLDSENIIVRVTSAEKTEIYRQVSDIAGTNSGSLIYFIQEVEERKYEIIFGDGVFGRKPENNDIIEIRYLLCNGTDANFCSVGSFIGNITYPNGNGFFGNIEIISASNALGGTDMESLESIKYNAPRYLMTGNRCVTTSDYATILPKIYPNISDIVVYGGENELPPQYGTVVISIKPKTGDFLTQTEKIRILNLLKNYSIAAIKPVISDISVVYLLINSTVYYNPPSTKKTKTELENLVHQEILNYNLELFGSRFHYSKLISAIDSVDAAISGNITKLKLMKRITANLNIQTSYTVCYGNRLWGRKDTPTITSSGFVLAGDTNTYYIEDDGNGNLVRFYISNGSKVYRGRVGRVNYSTSEVTINPIQITSTVLNSNRLEIYAIPFSFDVLAVRNTILRFGEPTIGVVENTTFPVSST